MGNPHGPGGKFDTSRNLCVNLVTKMIASNPAAATPTEKPCQNTSTHDSLLVGLQLVNFHSRLVQHRKSTWITDLIFEDHNYWNLAGISVVVSLEQLCHT
jgi:hypothetical protein